MAPAADGKDQEALRLTQAAAVLAALGGAANVQRLRHCTTRLRVRTVKFELIDLTALKNAPGVLDVILAGSEVQVVAVEGVDELCAAVKLLCGESETVKQRLKRRPPETAGTQHRAGMRAAAARQALTVFGALTGMLAAVIMPMIGFLAAAGILKALSGLLVFLGLISTQDYSWQFIDIIFSSLINFLPVLLGFTTARYFGTNPLVGIVLGMCLVPDVYRLLAEVLPVHNAVLTPLIDSVQRYLGSRFHFSEYSVSIIPMVISACLNVYLEQAVRRCVSPSLHYLAVPLCCLAVCVPIIVIVITPLCTALSYAVSDLLLKLYEASPALIGIGVGGLWELLVCLGLHWLFSPAMVNNITLLGFDVLSPINMAPTFAVAGVMLGRWLTQRQAGAQRGLKNACVMALCGITEPALYGHLLKERALLAAACLIGAAGGAAAALLHIYFYSVPMPSLFALPLAYSPLAAAGGMPFFLISAVSFTCFAAGIGSALLLSARAGAGSKGNGTAERKAKSQPLLALHAPCRGHYLPLTEVKDPIFSALMLGDGFAVVPEEDVLRAPCAGVLSSEIVFPHAVGLTADCGAEILLHAGINTVRLEGRHFKLLAAPGSRVEAGDPLLAFERAAVAAEGFDVSVLTIVTQLPSGAVLTHAPLSSGAPVQAADQLASVSCPA